MALLPKALRFALFDALSLKTMRFVHAVPRRQATGLVAEVYEQIDNDFFINGSLTSRSKVPNLLAAIWTGGRETILVSDHLDRTTKEAIAATLSSINDCPYCGDMLISLVQAGDCADDARQILREEEESISDPVLRERLTWVKAVATPGQAAPESTPFSHAQLPEVVGTIMAMSDINRFSHIVMDGSPVSAPLGLSRVKEWALQLFGNELRPTHSDFIEPGRTLHLLPEASLPEDLHWASSNPRIANAIARWTTAVEREARGVITEAVHECVHYRLASWQGELMPLSRGWVEDEVDQLANDDYVIGKFALLMAKASSQIDEQLMEQVRRIAGSEEQFVRILAWCSYTASRFVANRIAKIAQQRPHQVVRAA
jgi:hypothetical protein